MRKALIIGNSNYLKNNEKLKNPINDAKGINEILIYKGFRTNLYLDLTEEETNKAFNRFLSKLKEGDDIVFFFAGHGIEDRDTNYILSIDYHKEFDLAKSITVDKIQNSLFEKNRSGIKIIIIDACRDNKVQAYTNTPKKTKSNNNAIVAFSTSSGNTAKDGLDKNSYYTHSLIKNIKKYNLSIYDVLSKTREAVLQKTKYVQVPWEYGSLRENSFFKFDNITPPTKLYNIERIDSKFTYSVKSVNDIFFIAGESKYVKVYSSKDEKAKILTKKNIDEGYCIEKMELTNDSIVLINSDSEVLFKKFKENDFKSIKCDFTLYSLSINNSGLIFSGGISSKALIYDAKKSTCHYLDIKKEVLKKTITNKEEIDYISKNINILSSNFSVVDDNIIAFGGSHSIFCIKNLSENKYKYIQKSRENFNYTYSISFSKNGKFIATAHEDGKSLLWDYNTLNIIHTFKINRNISKNEFFEFRNEKHSNHINHIEFSPDSRYLAISTSESKLIFFDINHMEKISEIDLNIEPIPIYSFAFNGAGDKITTSFRGKLYQFKV